MKARLGVPLLLAALVSCTLMSTASTASAAGVTARLTQTSPIIGQQIQVTGVIAPGNRPIQLQRYEAGRWVRVLTSHTVGAGSYSLPLSATATRTGYRAFAPAVRINRHRYAARASNSVTVTGAKASGVLDFAPAPVGPSPSVTSPDLTPGVATFSPVRPGAPVTVQRLAGSTWTTVATGTQTAAGTYSFSVPGGSGTSPATFRAFTRPSGVTIMTPSARPTYWSLAWHDEFNGSSLDTTTWKSRQVNQYFGKRTCAAVLDAQTGVGSGVARLSVSKAVNTKGTTACPKGMYSNAMIGTDPTEHADPSTQGKQFTYGMFAARVKFQSGGGQHGAFWLQSATQGGAEVDAAEYFGDDRADGGLNSYVHHTDQTGKLTTLGGAQPTSKAILGAGHTPSNGWHVYSVQWTASEYVFRIDGVVTYRTASYVSQQPAFPVLSLLTSDWELPNLDTTKLPSSMSVDWVRVWQH